MFLWDLEIQERRDRFLISRISRKETSFQKIHMTNSNIAIACDNTHVYYDNVSFNSNKL